MAAELIQTVDVSRLTAETLVMDNPVLVKHVRSRLRPQHVIPGVVIIVILAALTLFACFKLDAVRNGGAFLLITGLQAVILYLGGTSQVATATAEARSTGILDFHRVSPLRALTVTLGFTLGASVREWVMFATLLPFSLACVGGGNPDAVGWLKTLAAMMVSALLYHTIATLVGVAARPRTAGGVAVVVVFVLLGVDRLSPIMTVLNVTHIAALHAGSGFFGVRTSNFVLEMIHQVPLLVFLFIAAVRKIRHDRALYYSRPVALTLFALVGAFVLGDTHRWSADRELFKGFTPIFAAYVLTMAGLLLAPAVTPGWGDFANGIRRARKDGRARLGSMADFASNIVPLAAISLMTVLTPIVSHFLRHDGPSLRNPAIFTGFVGGCTVLFFGCALQAFGFTYRKAARAYFGLFVFLTWIVPLLLAAVAGITDAGEKVGLTFLALSPLAGIGFAGAMQEPDFTTKPIVWLPWVTIGVPAVMAVLFVFLSMASARRAEARSEQR